MLTDAEILAMRATMSDTLVDTCDVYRVGAGSDVEGFAGDDGWTLQADDVACRVSPEGGTAETSGSSGGVVATATWVVTLPTGTAVRETDVLVIDSTVYEVIGADAGRTYDLAERVRCVLRKDQTLPVVA